MTTLKMIIAVLASLIFLGIFSATTDHPLIGYKTCDDKANAQMVNSVNFTCLGTSNTHLTKKG